MRIRLLQLWDNLPVQHTDMKTLLMGLLLLAFPAFGSGDSNMLKYYYIPFQTETYVPVTPQNLRNKAQFKGELTGEDSSKLLGLLAKNTQTATFDKKRVRLLVETQDGKNPIFVDAAGTALNGQDEYAINPKALVLLEKILRSLNGSR